MPPHRLGLHQGNEIVDVLSVSKLTPRVCSGSTQVLMRLNLLHSSVWARPITSVWRQMVRGSQLSIEPNSQLFGLRSNRANADMDNSLTLPASCPALRPSLFSLTFAYSRLFYSPLPMWLCKEPVLLRSIITTRASWSVQSGSRT